MLLKLYQVGQPVLRKPAKNLTRKALAYTSVQGVIDYMIATLRDAPGVGLAAPQVGESLRIIIVEDKRGYHKQVPSELLKAQGRRPIRLQVLVNPELRVIDSSPSLFFEGCLSVEGYVAAVSRARSVRVDAWDRSGKPVSFVARDWHARILQHELDHLDGELYTDRMLGRSFMTTKNFSLLWRKALPAEIVRTFNNYNKNSGKKPGHGSS